ncbi:hypothetical protein HPB52_015557 [Rhipicephalus sanguineus]|uniref:Uncharacterized protein n=1 Tax=Rhipicephalus sanguineus TaxID=34632 RepID=A0A9D4PWI9_RHISA|nr:hypothetical protein HPB52_015557 [Rhipicephalus sanguineus]
MASEDNTLNFPLLCHSKTSTPLPIGATAARQRLSQRHNLHTTNAVFTDAALDGQSLALAWYKPSTGEAKRYICRMDYATPTQAELLAIWTALQDNIAPSTIYTDSYEALKDIENPNTEDVAALRIRKILLHKQKNGIDTRVAWTPGHSRHLECWSSTISSPTSPTWISRSWLPPLHEFATELSFRNGTTAMLPQVH